MRRSTRRALARGPRALSNEAMTVRFAMLLCLAVGAFVGEPGLVHAAHDAPVPASDGGAAWNATPRALVHAFQTDVFAWNAAANARSRDAVDGYAAMQAAQREYAELLRRFVLPGFPREPIAYGDSSAHDPVRERTLAVLVDGDAATVRTRLARDGYSPVYEYELVRRHGRWYLQQVYLADGDERLPGL